MQFASGYPVTLFVENVQEKFDVTCSICMDVLNEPMQCRKGHLYCQICILEALSISKTCPICTKEISESELAANLFVKNLIHSFPIKCSTAIVQSVAKGDDFICKWTGCLSKLESHLQECGYVEVPCDNEGCVEFIAKVESLEHKKTCPYRLESCQHCTDLFKLVDLEAHLSVCPKRPVHCENEGCGETVVLAELKWHKQVCLWEQIDCPLNLINACSEQCPRNLLRKDLESHLSSSSTICASIQALVGLKQENMKLYEKLQSTEEKLSKNTTELENMKFKSDIAQISRRLNVGTDIINCGSPSIVHRWLTDIETTTEDKVTLSSLTDLLMDCPFDCKVRHIAWEIPDFKAEVTTASSPSPAQLYSDWILFDKNIKGRMIMYITASKPEIGCYVEMNGARCTTEVFFTLLRIGRGATVESTIKHKFTIDERRGRTNFLSMNNLETEKFIIQEENYTFKMLISFYLEDDEDNNDDSYDESDDEDTTKRQRVIIPMSYTEKVQFDIQILKLARRIIILQSVICNNGPANILQRWLTKIEENRDYESLSILSEQILLNKGINWSTRHVVCEISKDNIIHITPTVNLGLLARHHRHREIDREVLNTSVPFSNEINLKYSLKYASSKSSSSTSSSSSEVLLCRCEMNHFRGRMERICTLFRIGKGKPKQVKDNVAKNSVELISKNSLFFDKFISTNDEGYVINLLITFSIERKEDHVVLNNSV
eukprot:gene11393-23840_t